MKQEYTVSNSGKGSFRRKDYKFSRVYLLRFSKGQSRLPDIGINNNNIRRCVSVLNTLKKCTTERSLKIN